MTENKQLSFEQAIEKLEMIIQKIETDEIDLESALNQYKEGMELIKYCQNKLRDIEQKVKILDLDSEQLKDFQAD